MSNVELNLGSGGKTARTETKGGFESQVVLVDLGGLGAESLLTGAMPVTGTFWQATQPVSGTFWQATQPVSLASVPSHAVTNAGTFAVQATQAGTWTVTGAGGTFPVTGTFWQATQPVSGTFWQATQPVSGTVAATQSGTWNIGTVTTVTTVSAVTAITNALPAGTNLLGQISGSDETGTIYSGTTALTPKFATFSTSSSGATTVVALVGGKRIRVLRWRVTSNGTTNVKWQSHVTPTDISGLSYCTQFKDCGGGYCPVGHFQTVSGEALDINNSAAIAISGEVTYIEV